MNDQLSPALIIGTGLIGASVGRALTASGVTVHLIDKVSSHAVVAATIGAGTTDPVDPEAVRLVIVAVPPGALVKVIAKALSQYPQAIVTDVGSVKSKILHELWETPGVDLTRYVGSHPMAGTHHAGPLTASATLFVDRTWVLAPHRASSERAIEVVTELAQRCGAWIVRLDVDDHDTAVAQVSHLPHVMSVLTAGQLTDVPASHLRLAGPGVRDVTRIAGSDPGLWRQIITANAHAVRAELEQVRDRMNMLLEELDDPDAVERILQQGRDGTRVLPGKHGMPPTEYGHVVVELPDSPGSFGRLFREIDALGINIEDLDIEHDPVRNAGYLSVAVAVGEVDELSARMVASGWRLRPQ